METTVIIPNYNGKKFLEECLKALSNQSYTAYEVIFVDNASEDGSVQFIEDNYPDIEIIKNNKNTGFSYAVNQGIRKARGEYIVLLNNDTVPNKDWLEELIKCIKKDEKLFSVCSKMIQYNDPQKIDDAGDEYNVLGWAWKRGDGEAVDRYNITKEVFSSCAGAAVYRKKILDEIGGFDESFFAYMEDVDISYRAKIFGYKNKYCAEAGILHVGSGTSGSKYNSFKIRLAARNNIFVAYKNMPFIQLIINFPFLLVGFLIKFFFFYKKGFSEEYINGFKDGIKSLHKTEKVEFKVENLFNYFIIELLLIINVFKYFGYKIFRR